MLDKIKAYFTKKNNSVADIEKLSDGVLDPLLVEFNRKLQMSSIDQIYVDPLGNNPHITLTSKSKRITLKKLPKALWHFSGESKDSNNIECVIEYYIQDNVQNIEYINSIFKRIDERMQAYILDFVKS